MFCITRQICDPEKIYPYKNRLFLYKLTESELILIYFDLKSITKTFNLVAH
jgi:hypothetical protein